MTLEREQAVVNKLLMRSGRNEKEVVLDVTVEPDEATMIVSVIVALETVLQSILSIVTPVMTPQASLSGWCLPVATDVVTLHGYSRMSSSGNLPFRVVAQERC